MKRAPLWPLLAVAAVIVSATGVTLFTAAITGALDTPPPTVSVEDLRAIRAAKENMAWSEKAQATGGER